MTVDKKKKARKDEALDKKYGTRGTQKTTSKKSVAKKGLSKDAIAKKGQAKKRAPSTGGVARAAGTPKGRAKDKPNQENRPQQGNRRCASTGGVARAAEGRGQARRNPQRGHKGAARRRLPALRQ